MYKVMNKQSGLFYTIEGFWKYWSKEGSLLNQEQVSELSNKFKNRIQIISAR